MATTAVVSCDNCKSEMELELQRAREEHDDDHEGWNLIEIECPACHQIFYIARVEVHDSIVVY